MNIFVLSRIPQDAAQMHCDKHVSKMTVETAQMLSTCHRILDGDKAPSELYKAAYVNHPCNKWLRESGGNYKWTYELFEALANEFKFRYGKEHKSYLKLEPYLREAPQNIPHRLSGKMTPFALAMSEFPQCIVPGNAVQSYRNFYESKSSRFAMRWTKRDCPIWFNACA